MKSTAPNSSAFCQTGWKRGSENSLSATLPPIAAPFSPCFFIAVSSSCTASCGSCRVSEAEAGEAVRMGGAELRHLLVVNLDDLRGVVARRRGTRRDSPRAPPCPPSACPWRRSAAAPRSGASSAPRTWLIRTARLLSTSGRVSAKTQCAWVSMILTVLPFTATAVRRPVPWACAASSSPQLQNTTPLAAAPRRKFLRDVIGSRPPLLDLPAGSPESAPDASRKRCCVAAGVRPVPTRARASVASGAPPAPGSAPAGHPPPRAAGAGPRAAARQQSTPPIERVQ